MGENSRIDWCDATWEPVQGCTKVSPGCKHCYAATLANGRMSRFYPDGFGAVTTRPDKLDQPLCWQRPRRIFVCSRADLFHEDVPGADIFEVFWVMSRAAQHTFLVLTKRPERMVAWFTEIEYWDQHASLAAAKGIWPLPNVWLGVSVEDQQRADERIPILLDSPAAHRFVSAEPLLGPLDLGRWLQQPYGSDGCRHDWEERDFPGYDRHWVCDNCAKVRLTRPPTPRPTLDAVIVGGESGPGARPMHPDWPRRVRDDCAAAGAEFAMKQWGAWAPCVDNGPLPAQCRYVDLDGTVRIGDAQDDTDMCMVRVGKRAAGALLDGRLHDDWPVPPLEVE
jgi:protein gp37